MAHPPRGATPALGNIDSQFTQMQFVVNSHISKLASNERLARSAYDTETPALQEQTSRNDEEIQRLQREIQGLQRENQVAQNRIVQLRGAYEDARDQKQRADSFFEHVRENLVRPSHFFDSSVRRISDVPSPEKRCSP